MEKLKRDVEEFCERRDWDQYHDAKELAIGLSTESSELLDLFRFKSKEDIEQMLSEGGKREEVGDELADIFYFLLRFSQMYDIDLTEEFQRKMEKNREKYPVDKSKGKNKKYSELK